MTVTDDLQHADNVLAREAAHTRVDATRQSGSHESRDLTLPFQLPAPFSERPRTGSRIFVQSHFPGIAGALASEMLSWQQEARVRYLLSCAALCCVAVGIRL